MDNEDDVKINEVKDFEFMFTSCEISAVFLYKIHWKQLSKISACKFKSIWTSTKNII